LHNGYCDIDKFLAPHLASVPEKPRFQEKRVTNNSHFPLSASRSARTFITFWRRLAVASPSYLTFQGIFLNIVLHLNSSSRSPKPNALALFFEIIKCRKIKLLENSDKQVKEKKMLKKCRNYIISRNNKKHKTFTY
jgi:hypothetical protein